MKKNSTSVSQIIIVSVLASSILSLFYSYYSIWEGVEKFEKANEQRYASYLLADELRQSSDDLTRLGRTYVVTGDAEYERQYMSVLDIRNGKAPRPQNYERIYWDFVAAGDTKPRPDTVSISLTELMKEAGFTDAEFSKLKEAQDNSNELVITPSFVNSTNTNLSILDTSSGQGNIVTVPDITYLSLLQETKNTVAESNKIIFFIIKCVN